MSACKGCGAGEGCAGFVACGCCAKCRVCGEVHGGARVAPAAPSTPPTWPWPAPGPWPWGPPVLPYVQPFWVIPFDPQPHPWPSDWWTITSTVTPDPEIRAAPVVAAGVRDQDGPLSAGTPTIDAKYHTAKLDS